MGRATATILFTDLVGSTELRSRLGEDAADELRRKHDQLLAQAVEANHGRVIKGLGDGIMASFAGAADAVAAAVAIQQAVDRLNRSGKAPVPIALRVGLSAGDVASEDDDVHGTPVIEASRLCGAAVGGEILASEIVRWLGGAQGAPSFIPVGSLELKGVATPVPAGRIEWEPTPTSTIPMPALLTHIGRIFVGRDAELDRLTQLWKVSVAGERHVSLLAGEPGVGKTRLAAELAIRVHDEGGVVLAGRCDEDMGVPYQPFVEALRQYVDHAAEGRLGRYGGELTRLVPELTERLDDRPTPIRSDPETERYRLFEAVASWLAAASAEEPLLLVLDDLQWAAKPTLLLLRHIVRSADDQRILILGTYRDTELRHDHPLVEMVADLRRQGQVERLSLIGLESSEVADFMAQATGHDLSAEHLALAEAIHHETEGNPLFVREVLRHLTETGAIEHRKNGSASRLSVEASGIPESVRDVIGRRLSRLSEEANKILRVGAVAGAEFEVPVLEAAGELNEEALLSSLEEATSAHLLIEMEDRYRFVHMLVRDTLYTDLGSARRATLHRRVAEAIEAVHAGALDDYLPALTHHWERALSSAAHTTRAAVYAARAGDRALAQLANDEAVSYYRHALELDDMAEAAATETWRIDVLIALGEAEHRSGEEGYPPVLLEAAERAERLGDSDRLARAALAAYPSARHLRDKTGGSLTGLCEFPFAVPLSGNTGRARVLEAALRIRGNRQDAMRARLLAVLAGEFVFVPERIRRRELSDEAMAIARRLGDRTTLARVLISRLCAIWDPPTLEERRANAAELRTVAADLGDSFVKVWASMYSFESAMEAGEVEDADGHLADAERSAAAVERALLWFAAFPRVGRMLLAGQVAEADIRARETLDIGLATQPPYEARRYFSVQRYQIRLEQGRLAELVDNLLGAVDDFDYPESLTMLAEAYCELDRWDEARATFAALVQRLPDLPLDPNWITTMTRAAAVCGQLGDATAAPTIYDLLLPFAGRVAGQGVVWTGSVAHYLGVLAAELGDVVTAETHFAKAEAMHQRIGAPCWLARTRLEWARMLIRRHPGDVERARRLLGQAMVTARELGLPNVERRAVELLG